MESNYFTSADGLTDGVTSPLNPEADTFSAKKANALSTKLASVLSSSYADSEIREALHLLDVQAVRNNDDVRRNLKFEAQKEVIDSNSRIVDDFGHVAEVRMVSFLWQSI